MHRLTAAHRTLPFGTRVVVTNLENGRTVIVTINDRGPFKGNRVIDVSQKAAGQLGFLNQGLTRVGMRILASSQG
jgi:rare lipoprotein A